MDTRAVHRPNGSGCLMRRLRYGRALCESMGRKYSYVNCSVGEPAEGSLSSLKGVVAGLPGHVHTLLIHSTPVHLLWVSDVARAFVGSRGNRAHVYYTNASVYECTSRFNAYNTTFSNGSLGSRIDEERSEMR